MKRNIPAALLVGAVLLSAGVALAEDAPGPKALIDGKYTEIQTAIAEDKTDEGVRSKVVAVLESFTDFTEFGRQTLKRDWDDLSEKQRALFVDRYRQLIHKSYVKHFHANQDLKVEHRGEPKMRGGKAMVMTTVTSGKSSAEVDYKLHQADGKWRAYDIVIDEVSLMRSYRKQFGGIIKKSGFDKLIEKIEKKIAESDED